MSECDICQVFHRIPKKGILSGVWLFSGDVCVVEGTLVEPGVVHSPWICGEVVFENFVCYE